MLTKALVVIGLGLCVSASAGPHATRLAIGDGLESPQSPQVAWVMDSLKRMQTIKVDMTRADLLRVFKTEGGLSGRQQQTYVFLDCPYFKVDVTFRPVGAAENTFTGESSADVITSISRPYLQWSIMN